LRPEEIDVLRRCELAERFTSPTVSTTKPRPSTFVLLKDMGLICWAPGWRLTEKGREALKNA